MAVDFGVYEIIRFILCLLSTIGEKGRCIQVLRVQSRQVDTQMKKVETTELCTERAVTMEIAISALVWTKYNI